MSQERDRKIHVDKIFKINWCLYIAQEQTQISIIQIIYELSLIIMNELTGYIINFG